MASKIDIARACNNAWGVNNWNYSVTNQIVDFIDVKKDEFEVGVTSFVRIELKTTGKVVEDVGFAAVSNKSKAEAFSQARRISVTNALSEIIQTINEDILKAAVNIGLSPFGETYSLCSLPDEIIETEPAVTSSIKIPSIHTKNYLEKKAVENSQSPCKIVQSNSCQSKKKLKLESDQPNRSAALDAPAVPLVVQLPTVSETPDAKLKRLQLQKLKQDEFRKNLIMKNQSACK